MSAIDNRTVTINIKLSRASDDVWELYVNGNLLRTYTNYNEAKFDFLILMGDSKDEIIS